MRIQVSDFSLYMIIFQIATNLAKATAQEETQNNVSSVMKDILRMKMKVVKVGLPF